MQKDTSAPQDFGYYRPKRASQLLRMLTALGISRGKIKNWMVRQWIKSGHTIVDANVRGVNYRLNLLDNTTDVKVLVGSSFYDGKELTCLADAAVMSAFPVFVDIGANTGYYSLNLAARGYKKIIAIEPNPPTVERLSFNVVANDMQDKIIIAPVCIGDGGDVAFYNSGDLGSASVHRRDWNAGEAATMVATKPLLDIMRENDVREISGMKIDVEGFEDGILLPFYQSAPRKMWPKTVVIEHCHRQLWKKDILEEMRLMGYQRRYRTRANEVLVLCESGGN